MTYRLCRPQVLQRNGQFHFFLQIFARGGRGGARKVAGKNEIGRVRDIEINDFGEVFLIADELDSNLFILRP